MEREQDIRWLAFDYKVEGFVELYRIALPVPAHLWGERSVTTQLAEHGWRLVNQQFPDKLINRVELYGHEVTDPEEKARLAEYARQALGSHAGVIEVEIEQ